MAWDGGIAMKRSTTAGKNEDVEDALPFGDPWVLSSQL